MKRLKNNVISKEAKTIYVRGIFLNEMLMIFLRTSNSPSNITFKSIFDDIVALIDRQRQKFINETRIIHAQSDTWLFVWSKKIYIHALWTDGSLRILVRQEVMEKSRDREGQSWSSRDSDREWSTEWWKRSWSSITERSSDYQGSQSSWTGDDEDHMITDVCESMNGGSVNEFSLTEGSRSGNVKNRIARTVVWKKSADAMGVLSSWSYVLEYNAALAWRDVWYGWRTYEKSSLWLSEYRT